MIIDTSAILAVLFAEEDATIYAQTIANADTKLMSAANYLEAAVVVDQQMGAAAGRQLDAFIDRAEIKIESVTREQAELARQAYSDFGKGHHPAALNFGDCFAYALAKHTRLPILFKGDDFSHTDLSSAL